MSFGTGNNGTQVGVNNGSIHCQYVKSENKQPDVDKGVLRSLSFPEMLDRRDNIAPCHTGTCQWILHHDNYKNWSIESRGLLWIKGKPGAGKSTLMAFLYSQLDESQELREPPDRDQRIQLDFFFSARGTELQHTPLGMLQSLLNQLYHRDENVRPPIRKIFQDRCRQYGHDKAHWKWSQAKLEVLLEDAILESAKDQQVMIFVDALDEAGADSARNVAAYFHRIASHAEKEKAAVKICISCRHYPIVEDAQAFNIVVEDHNSGDIASYIEDAFSAIASGANQQELQDLTAHLIRQADGVFQWIQLLVPSIKRRIDEGESLDEIYSWLREVPAGLKEVYVYIIKHVIEERNRKQSFLLFQWVCLAERPLSVTEMRYALATQDMQISLSQSSASRICISPNSIESARHFINSDNRMKTRVKALSGGLVEVIPSEYDGEIVQAVHQSVNDFLCESGFGLLSSYVNAKLSPLSDVKIVREVCQATLYRSCLIVVAKYAQVWETTKDPTIDPNHLAQEILDRHKILPYARECLFIHAKNASESRLGILKNEVDLLQSIIEAWVPLQIFTRLSVSDHPELQNGVALLHVAAAYDLVDILEFLLSRTEHIEARDYLGNTALHIAAQQGHMRASKILYERGVSYEAKNDDGMTALIGSANHGNLELFEWLLGKGIMAGILNDTLTGGALWAASREGHTKVVQMLLDAHVDVNFQQKGAGNSLQAAAHGGHLEVVRILLDSHADVNAGGGQYGKALKAAVDGGNAEVVRMLLNAGINTYGDDYGDALSCAVCKQHSELLEILLDFHADFDGQVRKYGSALHAAAYVGNVKVVQMLLDAHTDVDAQGYWGNGNHGSALQAAASMGHAKIIQMLLNASANFNSEDSQYGNALQAAACEGHTEIVKILLDASANVDAQGGRFGNALQAAAFSGNTEVMKVLLDASANVNAQGGQYGNALQAAAVAGRTEAMRILLDASANVNAQGGQYGNALQAAAVAGRTEAMRILLDASANVNAQGGQYGNALQAAAVAGRTEAIKMLLDASANVNAQGGPYENALQAAAFHGYDEVTEILLNACASATGNSQGRLYRIVLQAAIFEGNSDAIHTILDSHTDFDLQGESYPSAILASALSAEVPDHVRFPLDERAYLPPLDDLEQNPLHIAVSKSPAIERLNNTIYYLPALGLVLDNRDKLLRTPLHAAIYQASTPSSAIKLLGLGADPSILDGYGRNILDWIQDNRYWMGRVQPHCPQVLLTPHETQHLTVCQSAFSCAQTITHSLPDLQWPLLHQLGHFLLFLEDEDRATYLFQFFLLPGTELFKIGCTVCINWIYGHVYLCRKCPNVVRCSDCVNDTLGRWPLHTSEHKNFKISAFSATEKYSGPTSCEELGLFLRDIMSDYSAAIAIKPKKLCSRDKTSFPIQETILESAKTRIILGPTIIASLVIIGTLGILLEYLYF